MGEYVNDQGERVIMGSRRPDGTFRKDIKVRAGYVPQDEQPVYVPRGAVAIQGAPKVPGMDNAELEAAKAAARSKAAKKNAQRKAKKAAGPASPAPAQAGEVDISNGMASVRLSNGDASKSSAPAEGTSGRQSQLASSEQEAAGSEPAAAEKLLRALQKKLRQCEALQERQAKGETLTQPEIDKLVKVPAWKDEARDLEALVSSSQ